MELLREEDDKDLHSERSLGADGLRRELDAISDRNNITTLQLNIRSIQKNFDDFLLLLEILSVSNIHIIILTESWRVENVSIFHIEGYQTFYNDALFNQNDGSIIFIKNSLSPMVNHIKLTEVTLTIININVYNCDFGIFCMYRPPATNTLQFIKDINKYINENINNNYLYLLMGDINIDLLDSNSLISNEYQSCLLSHGFESLINIPTRVADNSSTCIDHCFIKKCNAIKNKLKINPFVLETTITDHYATVVNLEFYIKAKNSEHDSGVSFNKIDKNKLNISIRQKPWQNVLQLDHPNDATKLLTKYINDSINYATVPIKQSNKTKKLKEWMTNGLLTSIRKRDKMKFNLKKHYSLELHNEFKNYRNQLTKLINITKESFYKQKISECSHNNKSLWKVINDITCIKSKNNQYINKLIVDDNVITGHKSVANEINEYFTNIGTSITNNVKTCYNSPLPMLSYCDKSIFLTPITQNEIIKYIKELNNSDTTGPDNISSKIIKEFHIFLIEPLIHIVNLIFKTGIVPDNFKSSIIIPLHKSGCRETCGNYRPISLTNNLSKIFEKCLKSRLVNFIEKNKLLSDNQFGFRQNSNTEKAILNLTDTIMSNFDQGLKTMCIFLDLQKAFDTVSHDRLLFKLEKLGIRGVCHELIKSYLSNRSQITRINGVLSEPKIMTTGLPQGTVLAPILFILYLNDLLEIPFDGKVSSYADDTVVTFSGQQWEDLEVKANTELYKIQTWLSHNLLSLNVNKTKAMTFSPNVTTQPTNQLTVRFHPDKCQYFQTKQCSCNNEIIQSVSEFKYLGITLDQFLKWKNHIINLSKRLRNRITVFYNLRNIVDYKTIKTVYNAVVQSLLDYCIIIWGGTYTTNLEILNISHKYILKTLLKRKKTYPSTEVYRESGVLPIYLNYVLACVKNLHKQKTDASKLQHPYDTRTHTSKKLKLPKVNKHLNIRYYKYLGIKFYNILPLEIRKTEKLYNFIQKSKQFIFLNHDLFEYVILI